jgi:hypothetical protein
MLRFSWTLALVEYDCLVERLDAFDDLCLIAHPNGLKNISEHLAFSSRKVAAHGLPLIQD